MSSSHETDFNYMFLVDGLKGVAYVRMCFGRRSVEWGEGAGGNWEDV